MKIGIIGTRGIPNHYGGFEQFADSLSTFLVKKKHEVFVYNSSNHPFKEKIYKDVNIIHCLDPENKVGTIGQFVYDLNCILDSRKRNYDIILQLGYTSSSIWSFLLPSKSIIITNMDGHEWNRSKYSSGTKRFLKYAEKLAVIKSNFLISDSLGIKNYLKNKYNMESKYIAYGSDIFDNPNEQILEKYTVKKFNYNMLIARLEPENNIDVILGGIDKSKDETPFLVIGGYKLNKYGRSLKEKYKDNSQIKFLGGIYNMNELNNLRYFSNIYFHGHSVGGTNPSLVEAMGSNAFIVAHKNKFNMSILQEDAYYFENNIDIQFFAEKLKKEKEKIKLKNNLKKISLYYNYDNINQLYLSFFNECTSLFK